jgi:hypothetical protein
LGDSQIKGSRKKHKMTNCIFRDFRFPFYVVFLPANSVIMLYIHQKVALLHMYTVSHSSVIQFEISLPVKKLTTKSSSKSVNAFLAHLTQRVSELFSSLGVRRRRPSTVVVRRPSSVRRTS